MFEDCKGWNLMAKRISVSLFLRCSLASRRILMRLEPRDLSNDFCSTVTDHSQYVLRRYDTEGI